jgi:hypothetical protein
METETKTRPTVGTFRGRPALLIGDQVLQVGADELRAIVQQAYDQYGILAEPSLEVETERFDRLQAEAADEHVRAFADAWGRSIGDQA